MNVKYERRNTKAHGGQFPRARAAAVQKYTAFTFGF